MASLASWPRRPERPLAVHPCATRHARRPREPPPRRVVDDLSTGWGSNSQWTTAFRRDYLVDGRLHYNVDEAVRGRHRVPPAEDLEPAALVQLLRHRCSTVVDHGGDLFPYDAHHVEPAP